MVLLFVRAGYRGKSGWWLLNSVDAVAFRPYRNPDTGEQCRKNSNQQNTMVGDMIKNQDNGIGHRYETATHIQRVKESENLGTVQKSPRGERRL